MKCIAFINAPTLSISLQWLYIHFPHGSLRDASMACNHIVGSSPFSMTPYILAWSGLVCESLVCKLMEVGGTELLEKDTLYFQ